MLMLPTLAQESDNALHVTGRLGAIRLVPAGADEVSAQAAEGINCAALCIGPRPLHRRQRSRTRPPIRKSTTAPPRYLLANSILCGTQCHRAYRTADGRRAGRLLRRPRMNALLWTLGASVDLVAATRRLRLQLATGSRPRIYLRCERQARPP